MVFYMMEIEMDLLQFIHKIAQVYSKIAHLIQFVYVRNISMPQLSLDWLH